MKIIHWQFLLLFLSLFLLAGCVKQADIVQDNSLNQQWDTQLLSAKDKAALKVYVIKHFHDEAVSVATRPITDSGKQQVKSCKDNIDKVFSYLKSQGVGSILIEGLPWKGANAANLNFTQEELEDLGVTKGAHDFTALKYFKVHGAEPDESQDIGKVVLTSTFPKILFDESSKYIKRYVESGQIAKAEQEIAEQAKLVYPLIRNEMLLDVAHIYRSMHSLLRAVHIANKDKVSKIAILMGDWHYLDYQFAAQRIPSLKVVPISCVE